MASFLKFAYVLTGLRLPRDHSTGRHRAGLTEHPEMPMSKKLAIFDEKRAQMGLKYPWVTYRGGAGRRSDSAV